MFPIGAGTVKWSINITKANNSLVGSNTIKLHYLLPDFAWRNSFHVCHLPFPGWLVRPKGIVPGDLLPYDFKLQ
jgi:hypothetical protein